MPSIIYYLPGAPSPSGGSSVMLDHVETLSDHGFSAFAVAPSRFKTWRETRARIVDGGTDWDCPKNSIIVFPEVTSDGTLSIFSRATSQSIVIFCQSYRGIDPNIGIFRDLSRYRIASFFANTQMVADQLEKVTGVRSAPLVSCHIDADAFTVKPKRLAVAYMSSKLPNAQSRIAELLGPLARQIEWIELRSVTRETVAEALAESAIFLALGYREGFGLPPLEAMASGCLVVGFHAEGAKAYATPANGFWHDEDDYKGVANSLRAAISLAQKKGDAYHRRLAAGHQTVGRYNTARMKQELLGYMTSLIVARGHSIGAFLTATTRAT